MNNTITQGRRGTPIDAAANGHLADAAGRSSATKKPPGACVGSLEPHSREGAIGCRAAPAAGWPGLVTLPQLGCAEQPSPRQLPPSPHPAAPDRPAVCVRLPARPQPPAAAEIAAAPASAPTHNVAQQNRSVIAGG